MILVSFPRYPLSPTLPKALPPVRDLVDARQVILNTYLKGMNEGDQNLYYVDGETLFGSRDQDACSVDYVHPNDLGFYRMAERIYPILKEALHIKASQ